MDAHQLLQICDAAVLAAALLVQAIGQHNGGVGAVVNALQHPGQQPGQSLLKVRRGIRCQCKEQQLFFGIQKEGTGIQGQVAFRQQIGLQLPQQPGQAVHEKGNVLPDNAAVFITAFH